MNEDICFMMKIYGTYELDWMDDTIKSPSDLTRHHIIKKELGGEDNIDNYALLTTKSHHLIHYMEDNYNKEYNYINSLFKELNLSVSPPTKDYYEKMRSVLKRVKKDIKNKKRNRYKKGKK